MKYAFLEEKSLEGRVAENLSLKLEIFIYCSTQTKKTLMNFKNSVQNSVFWLFNRLQKCATELSAKIVNSF